MKRIVIVGATSGIGLEVAKLCIQAGWQIGAAGRREEALRALEQAERKNICEMERSLALQLLRLVRYRLEHPDYLSREDYGVLLLDSFERLRRELPSGYAIFHLPWVLEWYKAARQYKKVCELLEEFPVRML